jgi:hypothetical protein
LFSRDTLPPLVLVVLLRYHQTTPKPAPKTSSITGTRLLDLVGSGVASFIQRRTTDADHHPRPMNTTTPFFSPIQLEYLNNDQIRQLDAICFEVTSKLFRVDCAERIIDALKYSRAARKGHYRTTPDFRHFIGIYHWVKAQTTDYGDYVVFRKYLKTLSGVYRWHFASFQHPSVRKSLHETIKIEVHCEHCGSLSKVLIDRLIEDNLWAV